MFEDESDLGGFQPTPHPSTVRLGLPNAESCIETGKIPCEFLFNQTITQKMETPVVYFYADNPIDEVRFEVSFPGGVISQSYPAPLTTLPLATPGVPLRNGYADYRFQILDPASREQPPMVDQENIYGHARNTQSNLIRSGAEIEKFIFYRGLGDFSPTLVTTSEGGGLSLKNSSPDTIPAAFLVYTEASGAGNIQTIGSVASGASVNFSSVELESTMKALAQEHFLSNARTKLVSALTLSGLFQDEAVAMVDTWENGYFKTPGLRVLYILPRSEVDEILPATLTPSPEQFERVFVGRLEILLDTQELKILSEIQAQGESYRVEALGSLSLPVLTRVRSLARESGLLTPALDQTIEALISRI